MGRLNGLMSKTSCHLLRIKEILPYSIPIKRKNSIPIKVGKLGAKKRTVEQSIGTELLIINIIFLKLSRIFIDNDTEDNDKGIYDIYDI